MGSPSKKTSTARVKKSVSVAAVFQSRNNRTNQTTRTHRASNGTSTFTKEDADGTTLTSAKSHSSPHRGVKKRTGKHVSDEHPLSAQLKDVTENHRRDLYKPASLKVNAALKSLLNTLHESTFQTTIPDSNDPSISTSPLKLSAAAKYEQLALQFHQPISQYTLTLRRTNSEGQEVSFQETLETRMQKYEDLIASQTEKLAKLQKEWEAVVGEIWKLGVQCLRENAMEDLIFTEQQHSDPVLLLSSSPSKSIDAESTLFVPEYGTSPSKSKIRQSKKHVTCIEKQQDKYGASPISSFPSFLYQPSRYTSDTLRAARGVPEQQIIHLNRAVDTLGQKEIKDFHSIEKEHRAFWKKKNAQLASALRED